jgi:hypothetical protein
MITLGSVNIQATCITINDLLISFDVKAANNPDSPECRLVALLREIISRSIGNLNSVPKERESDGRGQRVTGEE